MATKTKTAFETVTGNLGQLSQSELIELGDMVAALLNVPGFSRFFGTKEEEEDDQVEDVVDEPAAKGHVEAKMINGCGPYLYLRYWSGKTLKSKYIGKAKAKS